MSTQGSEQPIEHPVHSSDLEVDVAALSDRGLVRPGNEDHFLVVRFGRTLEPLATNLPAGTLPDDMSERGYVLMIADGMGGHAGGAEASRKAIAVVVEQVLAMPTWAFRLEPATAESARRRAEERFRQASVAIREEAARRPELAGMGTTLTVAVSFGLDLMLTHVGDSRAYLLRGDQLRLLSRDHTVGQDFLDRGADELADRFRHILTHALGGRNAEPESAIWRLEDGDRLLLCTDGLTDSLDDGAISATLRQHSTSEAACRALVDQALAAGGRDNVTVALAGYRVAGASDLKGL